jgi:hypothetical protein
MSFAKDRGMIAINPCEKGGRLYAADRTDKVWREPEIAALEAILDAHYLGRDVQLAEAAVLKLEKRTKP